MSNTKKVSIGIGALVAALGVGVLVTAVVSTASGRPAFRDRLAVRAGRAAVTIEIPEVGCAGCTPQVRRAIKSAGGVIGVSDGNGESQILVTYEPGAGRPEVYVEALHTAGYAKAHEIARP